VAGKIKDGDSKAYPLLTAGDHTVKQPSSGRTLTIHVLS
jgi:hypothetical protein